MQLDNFPHSAISDNSTISAVPSHCRNWKNSTGTHSVELILLQLLSFIVSLVLQHVHKFLIALADFK